MNDRIYQTIYDELAQYLRKGWEKLVVYLEYGEGYYSISFYEKNGGHYLKCYEIPGISEDKLDSSFTKIDNVISKERKKQNETWTNMTMVVDETGRMQTDFDYTDLSTGAYQFMKQWKKRYLV